MTRFRAARLLWTYLNLTYLRWWTATYLAVVGAYEVLTQAVPRLPGITAEALWWLALPLLFIAPFAVFVQLAGEADRARAEAAKWKLVYSKSFRESWVETFVGESSRKTRQDRANELRALFEQRRDELRAGDYSRVGEMIPIARHYLPLLHQVIPRGSVAYMNAEAEIREACDLAERHLFVAQEGAYSEATLGGR